jgi:hypothetical protein
VLVVALGVVVLAIALFALREPNGHVSSAESTGPSNVAKHSSPRTTKTTPAPRHSAHPGAVRNVPLVVLNNTSVHGLAEQAAHRFESGGWNVTSYGNLTNDIISTCAYYDPSSPGAQAAAQALRVQFPEIKRTVPRFAELPSAPVVVVLADDYAAG